MLTIEANAKVNLTLDILGKRSDGYHEVEMVMQSLDLSDTLTFRRLSQDDGIFLKSNITGLPADSRNLAYKAAALLKRCGGIKEGVSIGLDKRIPIAAGLGGGSSDAAATLKGLNAFWQLGLNAEELLKLGAEIGSDVPFCIEGNTRLAKGRGEVLAKLPSMPRCYIVLAKPEISVSTAWVYQNYQPESVNAHPDTKGILQCLGNGDLSGICERLCNVLESVTIKRYGIIAELKRKMRALGAEASLMSGSGPTVFALTPDAEKAAYIAEEIAKMKRIQVILTKTVGF